MARISTKPSHNGHLHTIFPLMFFVFLIVFTSSASEGRVLLVHQEENALNSSPRTTRRAFPAAAKTSPYDRQFHAAAHEVPSGPNPESN